MVTDHEAVPCILVAVDLSEISPNTLSWAARRYASEGGGERIADVATRLLGELIDGAADELAGLDVEYEVVAGVPATRILEVADQCGADHVVIGSHGGSGWVDRVLGSDAERVVRDARIPVSVVKSPPEAGE